MIEFQVPAMTCGHCVHTVTQALKASDPTCEIEVDLGARTLRVQSCAERAVLASALTAAGYPPA